MSKNLKALGAALLTLSACIWGGTFVAVKAVVNKIPPIELVWLRYLIAFIGIAIIALASKKKWRFNWHDTKLAIGVGLLGNLFALVTQETGTWLSNAQTGATITTLMPLFLVVFAWIFLKERIGKVQILSILIAMVGVFVIVGIHFSGNSLLLGVICLLASSMFWAGASILVEKVKYYTDLQLTTIGIGVALICLTPFVLHSWNVIASVNYLSFKPDFCLIYIGFISTTVADLTWNQGLDWLDADSAGLFYLIQPVAGAFLGWLFLNEQITVNFLIGMLLIIGGVFLYTKFGARTKRIS